RLLAALCTRTGPLSSPLSNPFAICTDCWRTSIITPSEYLNFNFIAVLVGQPVNAAGWKCNTIYKGFAECLVSLGDSMAQNVQKDMEDDTIQDQDELNTICRSWDDFHACASKVLSNCPEEAANIWESLRQESRKIQFQGNLHDLCSSRAQLAGDGKAFLTFTTVAAAAFWTSCSF
uniref:Neuritin 1 like n=1 Tax=Pseudonaja textilis TaxID=8673 RepID=A0A670ZTK9_PSETE